MHDFKNLQLWQKSMNLVTEVYKLTTHFPKEEVYGLTSQIKRCSISIPSNIAEGAGRNSDKEFLHFLSNSQGSAYELETQLTLAHQLEFVNPIQVKPILESLEEIQKMNRSLQNSLRGRL